MDVQFALVCMLFRVCAGMQLSVYSQIYVVAYVQVYTIHCIYMYVLFTFLPRSPEEAPKA